MLPQQTFCTKKSALYSLKISVIFIGLFSGVCGSLHLRYPRLTRKDEARHKTLRYSCEVLTSVLTSCA